MRPPSRSLVRLLSLASAVLVVAVLVKQSPDWQAFEPAAGRAVEPGEAPLSDGEAGLAEVRAVAATREANEAVEAPAAEAPPTAEDERAGWQVTVLDRAGAPIPGAMVRLLVDSVYPDGTVVSGKVAEAGPSGAAGDLFFPDPSEGSEPLTPENMRTGEFAFRLVPVGLFGFPAERREAGLEPVGVTVTPGEASPPVEVTLVRPAAGMARVTIRARSGDLPGGFDVLLTEGWRSLMAATYLSAPMEAGAPETTLLLDPIGVGRKLEAQVRSKTGNDLGKVAFDGPTQEGEVVDAILEIAGGGPRITGRVLGLAEGTVEVGVLGKTTRSSTLTPGSFRPMGTLKLGPGGAFVHEAAWLSAPFPINAQLRLRLKEDPARVFDQRVTVDPENPVVDLGDVRLGSLPVVVSGTIVDSTGRGVSTTVEVEFNATSPDGWERYVTKVTSAEDGTFEHRAALPPGELWLSLDSEVFVLAGGPGTIEVVPAGTEGVEFVVSGTGTLTLDASALPEGFLNHLMLEVSPQGLEGEALRQGREYSSVRNGPEHGPFASGSVHVVLSVWGQGEAASWDVVLPAGGTVDLGRPSWDLDLHGHTVILETGEDYLGDPPAVWGRAGSRTYHASPDHTGLRHTFLLRDPVESVFITTSITDSSSPTVDREVSGPETRIPWR
ncbi:hypothetical protein N9L90_01450 [Planctomycetota bacterium]|nr:hypothetical protein [Planctomycetota bacterium]